MGFLKNMNPKDLFILISDQWSLFDERHSTPDKVQLSAGTALLGAAKA
jgi:hypothetical protein